MIELGTKKGTILLEMPSYTLTDTVPGKVYNLKAEVQGSVTDPEALFNTLSTELYEKQKVKLLYLSTDNGVINMQVEAISASAWAGVIAVLPSIFTIFGLIIVSIAVFSVLYSIPSWAWALLAVGGLLIVISPRIGKALKRSR